MAKYQEVHDLNFPTSRGVTLCQFVSNEMRWTLKVHNATSFTFKKPLNLDMFPMNIDIILEAASAGMTRFIIKGSLFGIGPVVVYRIKKVIQKLWTTMELFAIAVREKEPVLLSIVAYVGGHPQLPHAGPVVIGLSQTDLAIYIFDKSSSISSICVPLLDIVEVGTGRPRTAREIYDEDKGYTIDVIQQSPFLSIVFKMQDYSYTMSFEGFQEKAAQNWANQIIALQYQARQTRYE